jgi:glycosyltransferase involved in cell wall biosynthesis
MNNNILLSVVIPTRNRRHLLSETLARIVPQCIRYADEVELIVADNASEDDTKTWLKENFDDKNISLHFFPDPVDIEASFLRTSRLAKGRFLCVFGDDDYPLPGFINALLDAIKTYPDLDLIHVDRLIADSNMENPRMYQSDLGLQDKLMSVREFIEIFQISPGFITSLICRTEFWQSDADFSPFDGYSFLARIYSQALDKISTQSIDGMCLYLASPLIVMRRSQTLWKNHWPRYFLVSYQRLLWWLKDTHGLNIKIKSSRFRDLIYILLLAKATIYPSNDQFWSNTLLFLPFSQKIVCQLIRYLFPKFLAVFILSRRKI